MERTMTRTIRSKRWLALIAAVFAAGLGIGRARADSASEARERCATRLSIALLGTSPSASLLSASNPQASVDMMLTSPAFIEQFSRFVNSVMNDEPGPTRVEDSAYYLSKEILTTNKQWKELFVGKYDVSLPTGSTTPTVTANANGLGYFRSIPWLRRYAGNEPAGYKIATAYRIMNNIIGLNLNAVTNAPGSDITATGRMAAACRVCHFDGPFALDLVARVLTRRRGTGTNMTFLAPTDGPQVALGGVTLTNDADVVNTLVASQDFKFRACRVAFLYLYGRAENSCEGAIFDRCMQAFNQDGMIQSALSVVAKDPSFCQ
jgi:hypothetical protein